MDAPPPNPEHVDVCIVGAGPIGLLLALLLHKQGVKVAIYERQPSAYPLPRAATLDHEAQRVLHGAGFKSQLAGLLQRVRSDEPGKTFSWRDPDGELIVDLHLDKPSISGFDRVSAFRQPELEGMLEAEVLKAGPGLVLRRGLELQDFRQDASEVTATFATWPPAPEEASTPHLITASFLVGCDGANSRVRDLSGIEVNDEGFHYDWLVCDLIPLDGYVPDIVKRYGNWQSCDPARPTTIVFGGNGRKRLEFMRLPHETNAELMVPAKAWSLAAKWGYLPSNSILERRAMYTFRARWAKTWNAGRILLAGDAAHQMPPFIGQGMNSGIRDAAGLAWRLPHVLNGPRSAALLQSYTDERLAHVESLTKHCIVLGKVICSLDPVEGKKMRTELRDNPPPDGYDPPLGSSSHLLPQPAAGKLALQRPVLSADGVGRLFDEVHGTGWRLVAVGAASSADVLPAPLAEQFGVRLGGKVVALTRDSDVTGAYHEWMAALDAHAVLVRPDFYVFGVAPSLVGAADLVGNALQAVCGV